MTKFGKNSANNFLKTKFKNQALQVSEEFSCVAQAEILILAGDQYIKQT